MLSSIATAARRSQLRRDPRARLNVLRRSPDLVRIAIPVLALVGMAATMAVLQPRVMSYIGMQLVLAFSLPLVLAAMAQLSVVAASDLDVGLGNFIGLVNCITAASMAAHPWLCSLSLAGCVAAYAALGAFVEIQRLPSIVVTLGASFVWLGLALLIMPTPGGGAPDWLTQIVRFRPPFVPLPILVAIAVAAVGQWVFRGSSYSVVLRGLGSSAAVVRSAGWSLLAARSILYGLAGVFGVLSGLALTGLIHSGDANVGTAYTLLSIAAVIVGGSEFSGGVVSPAGTVVGAFVLVLAGALLSFMNVPSDWQLGVQGLLLIVVLALRLLQRRVR